MSTSKFFSIAAIFFVIIQGGGFCWWLMYSNYNAEYKRLKDERSAIIHPAMGLWALSMGATQLCRLLSDPLPEKMNAWLYFNAGFFLLLLTFMFIGWMRMWRKMRKLLPNQPGDSPQVHPKTA
jgi:hypothetical protein